MAWGNNYNVGNCNTLSCRCSNTKGGAIRLSVYSNRPSTFITFCFFHQNTETLGKDICFNSLDTNPILHSFTSSSGTGRVYLTDSTDNQSPNWLPQGLVAHAGKG